MKSHQLSSLTLAFLLLTSVSQIRIKKLSLRPLSVSPTDTRYKADPETEISVKLIYIQISVFYDVVLVFVL